MSGSGVRWVVGQFRIDELIWTWQPIALPELPNLSRYFHITFLWASSNWTEPANKFLVDYLKHITRRLANTKLRQNSAHFRFILVWIGVKIYPYRIMTKQKRCCVAIQFAISHSESATLL